jgi:hypothetical protein
MENSITQASDVGPYVKSPLGIVKPGTRGTKGR